MVQFYPWFKFYFLLFLGMVMYDNEFETKEIKCKPRIKLNCEKRHVGNPVSSKIVLIVVIITTISTILLLFGHECRKKYY